MTGTSGHAALDTIQRPVLPPLPPAIQSPVMLAAPAPGEATLTAAPADLAAVDSTPVAPEVDPAPEESAFDMGVFPPTAAEMVAMNIEAAPEPKIDIVDDAPKPKPDLTPKGYQAKTIVSHLVKLVCAVFVAVLAFVGFGVFQEIRNTSLVTQLTSGQCVEDFFTPSEGEFRNVFTVGTTDCANPHAYEVFATSTEAFAEASTESNANYPGIEASFASGQAFCESQYDDFVGGDFATSPWQVWTFVPTEKRWSEGDRNVQCLVGDAAEVNLIEGTLADAGE